MSEETKAEAKAEVHYKITIFPYTKSAAQEIKNYLVAFTKKVIDIESVDMEKKP